GIGKKGRGTGRKEEGGQEGELRVGQHGGGKRVNKSVGIKKSEAKKRRQKGETVEVGKRESERGRIWEDGWGGWEERGGKGGGGGREKRRGKRRGGRGGGEGEGGGVGEEGGIGERGVEVKEGEKGDKKKGGERGGGEEGKGEEKNGR
ncbi:hypothetical protein, partial [Escherichia coli]|uniref:hypothetical protein n=1 Tax=Escherichia coli TaxID=562 RepID=UPI000989CC0C